MKLKKGECKKVVIEKKDNGYVVVANVRESEYRDEEQSLIEPRVSMALARARSFLEYENDDDGEF
jgi:hypothetical protein